jgi:hypothetical protein
MSSIINADTSDGLKITSDTSGEIDFQSGGVTKAGINSTGWTGDGSQLTNLTNVGKVLQVVFNRVDATTVYAGSPATIISDLNTTIVPISATSKLLITFNIFWECTNDVSLRILKNNSLITTAGEEGYNNVSGNQIWSGISVAHYDADTASTPLYQTLQYWNTSGDTASRYYGLLATSSIAASPIYKLNRAYNGATTGQAQYETGVSSVVIMEISA